MRFKSILFGAVLILIASSGPSSASFFGAAAEAKCTFAPGASQISIDGDLSRTCGARTHASTASIIDSAGVADCDDIPNAVGTGAETLFLQWDDSLGTGGEWKCISAATGGGGGADLLVRDEAGAVSDAAVTTIRFPDGTVSVNAAGDVSITPVNDREIFGATMTGGSPLTPAQGPFSQMSLALVEYADTQSLLEINPTGDLVCNNSGTTILFPELLVTVSMTHSPTALRGYAIRMGACSACDGDPFPQLVDGDDFAPTTILVNFHNQVDATSVALGGPVGTFLDGECLGLMMTAIDSNPNAVTAAVGTVAIYSGGGTLGGGGGSSTFLGLIDVDDTDYIGKEGFTAVVNGLADGLELLPQLQGAFQYQYRFDTDIDSTPVSGRTQIDTANPTLATEIYVHETPAVGPTPVLVLNGINNGDWVGLVDNNTQTAYIYLVTGPGVLVSNVYTYPISFVDADAGDLLGDGERISFAALKNQTPTVISHTDVANATGANLDTLTDGSVADSLHSHTGFSPDISPSFNHTSFNAESDVRIGLHTAIATAHQDPVGTSSDTEILFNDLGAVVGDSALNFDGTTLRAPFFQSDDNDGTNAHGFLDNPSGYTCSIAVPNDGALFMDSSITPDEWYGCLNGGVKTGSFVRYETSLDLRTDQQNWFIGENGTGRFKKFVLWSPDQASVLMEFGNFGLSQDADDDDTDGDGFFGGFRYRTLVDSSLKNHFVMPAGGAIELYSRMGEPGVKLYDGDLSSDFFTRISPGVNAANGVVILPPSGTLASIPMITNAGATIVLEVEEQFDGVVVCDNVGGCDAALAAAVTSMSFCVHDTDGTVGIILDPSTGDSIIMPDGTVLSAGVEMISTTANAAGDFVCIVAIDNDTWLSGAARGTWTAGS